MQRIKDLKSMGHHITLATPTTFSQLRQRDKALTAMLKIMNEKIKNTNFSKGRGGEDTRWDVCEPINLSAYIEA